jgi:5-methylthioadenosine/S-adenosylhomocysteine deaminase
VVPTPVDLIVEHLEYLVTVDGDRRVIADAAVAVDGGRFVAVGRTDEVTAGYAGRRVLDGRRHVATPGLIDSHLHSSFQLARGLADEANAQEFLIKRMYPYEAALAAEDVQAAARLAARELLRHGTTTFVDPGNNHPEQTVAGVQPTGIRVVVGRSAFDLGGSAFGTVPASMVTTPEAAADDAAGLVDRFHGTAGGRVLASVSFRGLNNSSDELIRALAAVAEDRGVVLQTHACFSYSTHDASVAKHGLAEIERLDRLGVLGPRCLLVHGGWLEPAEVALLRGSGASIVSAPSSSMHNGYGNLNVGLIPELLALGVTVALGSDHACSGPVDLVREMFLAACGYKEARLNPRVMPPESALEMATVNGAAALGLADTLGSVEVGKQADLVLFDADEPSWQPLYNPVSNLVYSATGDTVRTVLVGGEPVVEGGRLTRIDEAELVAATRAVAARLYGRLDGGRLDRALWPRS